MRWLLCFFCVSHLFAATVINGRIENGTHGGDGSVDRVQLVGLGQGMDVLASLDSVTGEFTLEYEGSLAGTSWLVQAVKGSVIYSVQGVSISDPVTVTVYDAASDAKITPRGGTIAISAIGQILDIGRFINLDNQTQPPVTLENPEGSFTFELEQGFRKVEASTTRGKMPLRQQLSIEGNQASLHYPLRPGRTQLMVRTEHGYNPSEENFYRLPLLENQTFAHVLVLPMTLDITGPGIQFVSRDEKQGVKLYEWEREPEQTHLEFTVAGASADSVPDLPPGTTNQTQQATHQGPEVRNHPHVLDRYRWYIVGGVVSFLTLITVVALFRKF